MNRYPVQTYVVQRQDALIKEAITREISRGGQVFYSLIKLRVWKVWLKDYKN